MPRHAFTTASLSNVGRVRTHNEDACREFENEAGLHLLIVADGMGGHRGGETASRVTVETVGEIFRGGCSEPESLLRSAVETANERVFELSKRDSELRGMGTTAVALLLAPDGRGWVAHVGDSRAYRYRNQRLSALTSDHSVVAELERRGLIDSEEAAAHPRRNEILRSVGADSEIEVDVSAIEIQLGDRFLLCSDGLHGMIDENEIAVILDENPPGDAALVLVERANEQGGHDNVTVQIVDIIDGQEANTSADRVAASISADETHQPSGAHSAADSRRRRRRAMMLGAGLLAGLTALALLYWVA